MLDIHLSGPGYTCPSCRSQYTELWTLEKMIEVGQGISCNYICSECNSTLTIDYNQDSEMSFYDIERAESIEITVQTIEQIHPEGLIEGA